MDASALDLPDDAFDVATASFVVHLVDDAPAMLARYCAGCCARAGGWRSPCPAARPWTVAAGRGSTG